MTRVDWDLRDDYLTYYAANNTETTPSILQSNLGYILDEAYTMYS